MASSDATDATVTIGHPVNKLCWSNAVLKLDYIVYWSSNNPYPAKVIYFNFQPLEVVRRYRDPQLQVAENY